MNFPLMPTQEVIGPTIDGVDFGVQMIILARDGDKLLAWEPGHTSYLNRMSGSTYNQGQLLFVHRFPVGSLRNSLGQNDRITPLRTDLSNGRDARSGGRGYYCLVRDVPRMMGAIEKGRDQIDMLFGTGVAAQIIGVRGKRTVAISGDPYPARVVKPRGPTKAEQRKVMIKTREERWAKGEIGRDLRLTKPELERLVELFADANDPITRRIAEQAKIALDRTQREADDPWRSR